MSTVYATSYGERIRGEGQRPKGELHQVIISTDPAEARAEARGWQRTGYQARVYSRRPAADGVHVPIFLVIVRRGGA